MGYNYEDRGMYARVYDISNRENPVRQKEINTSGWYRDSRMIGDQIYLVVNAPVYQYRPVSKTLCGGHHVVNGTWNPEKFNPRDTGQPIQLRISRLEYLVEQVSYENHRARFILLGHSLGGRIALDFVTMTNYDNRQKILAVITLNSPLVGAGREVPSRVMELLDHDGNKWSSPAVVELMWESNFVDEMDLVIVNL